MRVIDAFDIRQITVASFSTTDSITLPPVDCIGYQQLRLSIKRTGGTAVGTVQITATASINVSAWGA